MSRGLGVAVTEEHYAHLLKDDLVAASRQVQWPVEQEQFECRADWPTTREKRRNLTVRQRFEASLALPRALTSSARRRSYASS